MTYEEFDRMRRGQGFGDARTVSFEPLSRSAPHSHDKASLVYVVEGEFILNSPDGAARYQPGETCVLDKDIEHAEEAGPAGAVILVARK